MINFIYPQAPADYLERLHTVFEEDHVFSLAMIDAIIETSLSYGNKYLHNVISDNQKAMHEWSTDTATADK